MIGSFLGVRHDGWSFLSFGASFFLSTLLAIWKINIFEKWKKHLEIWSFYTCEPQMTIIYDVWFLRYSVRQTKFFCYFGLLFALLAPNNSDNQNFEKIKKKPGDIIILHMCTINEIYMIYSSWHMERNKQSFFYHFWTFFALSTPLTTQKIKFWKNEKNVWTYLHFTDRQNFSSFWVILCPFISLTAQKIKVLRKWIKRHDISSV